jgi:HSP20 family molecular chaperone IbpA
MAVSQQPSQPNQISIERAFTGSASFTRSISLPHAVDASGVMARLVDGVLTLRVPKAEDKKAFQVTVE